MTCLVCKGGGVVPVEEPVEPCSQCRGRGRESGNPNLPCGRCRGKGVIAVKSGMRKFLGRPSGTAGDIGMVIHDMGGASKAQIGRRLGLTSDYVAFVCESMIKKGYIEKVGRGIYALTQECEALFAKDEAVELERLTPQQVLLLGLVQEGEATVADLSPRAQMPVDQVQKICAAMAEKDFLDLLLNGRIQLARKGTKALDKYKKANLGATPRRE